MTVCVTSSFCTSFTSRYITIQSYEGEVAELSGGEPITGLEWTSANVTGRAGTAAVWSAPYDAGEAGLEAMRLRSTGRRVIRARYCFWFAFLLFSFLFHVSL